VSLSYVEAEGGGYAIAFVSDISQRKHLEEQLLHAQKMEAVGRLAGGVAHDFNNMLTVISGYNRMILDELSALDPLRGYAEEVLKAADRAGALTNQLLAFSRRQIMRPRVVGVNAVLAQTEKMLRRLIGEDVELVMRLDPGAGNIKADPGHVEQAVVNLVDNAVKYSPSGTAVHIEADREGEGILIRVRDEGCGIAGEHLPRLFERFYRVDKARSRESGGTGLGLAIAKHIVLAHGGTIRAESELNHGSTFLFTLAAAEQDSA